MDIMKLIPSHDIAQVGWNFSDWDQATILFNLSGVTLAERTALLKDLGRETQDRMLAGQIEQQLALQTETKNVFLRSAPGMFYMVIACDDDTPRGYFAAAEDAIRRGKRENEAFEVYKYCMIGAPGLPPLRKTVHWNPYFFGKEPPQEAPEPSDDDPEEYWAGCASFNKQGELCAIASRELLSVSEAVQVELAFSPKRFENRYVELPNPFQRGDIVRVAGSAGNGRRGVVETSQEQWVQFQDRIKDWLYVDFFDACITVEFLTEQGGFSHDHISPLYLEWYQSAQDDPDYDILKAGRLMLQGMCGLDYFTDCCHKYRTLFAEDLPKTPR